jgi:hypothetical protein
VRWGAVVNSRKHTSGEEVGYTSRKKPICFKNRQSRPVMSRAACTLRHYAIRHEN